MIKYLKLLMCILPWLNAFCLPMAAGMFFMSFTMLLENPAVGIFMIFTYGSCLYMYSLFVVSTFKEFKAVWKDLKF